MPLERKYEANADYSTHVTSRDSGRHHFKDSSIVSLTIRGKERTWANSVKER
jgi:hypothetical protein